MKVKLLKKIRKRFDYYFRTSDGSPVLVDKKKEKLIVITEEHCLKTYGHNSVEEYNKKPGLVSIETLKFIELKDIMLRAFGYNFNQIRFKASRKYWKHRNNKTILWQEK